MVFWIKQENGDTIRLEENWGHSIYVSSDDESNLKSIVNRIDSDLSGDDNFGCLVKGYEFTSRYERITDRTKSDVLKLKLSDSTKALTLARKIETIDGNYKFGRFRLYNVDLLPAQSYFYEQNIFPLAFCEVCHDYVDSSGGPYYSHSKLRWINKDDVWSLDYKMPDFRTIHLNLNPKKERGKIPRYTDRIDSILIIQQEGHESFEIQSQSEADVIEELVTEVTKKIEPDFIFTNNGDSFTFPYLIHRAETNGISNNLVLGRELTIPLKKPINEGTSYFSYGRIYFKPTTMKLFGRIHIDISNSFVWNEAGLQGLYEISRICRMPLHTAARASIGKCLSSLQFYYATQKGILVPWKPTLVEHFKTFKEMLIADRGGFIFEPEIGVHQQAAEFDFVSLYPNIMLKKNLSAETICCNCCPNCKLRVPELDYNICEKQNGIIPTSLKMLLEKRAQYKKVMNTTNHKLQAIYDARQTALKWILVTSFGYLGFNNAKFGRIDAHIAVCAFDRQILLQAAKIAERHGFRVLHGIVDSLWIQKNNNTTTKANHNDYLELKESIEQETGFTISFEGVYKWIVFANSKTNSKLPVVNRYFGAFEDRSLKIRGIEARRQDTPPFFSKCQIELLKIMSKGDSIEEVKTLMPKVKDTFQKYVQLLKERKVPLEELVFTKQLSKNSDEYQSRNSCDNNAMLQLSIEGKSLKAGQILKYIITDYYQKQSKEKMNRSIPAALINEKTTTYDVKRYTELLTQTCNSVTNPFGYTFSENALFL